MNRTRTLGEGDIYHITTRGVAQQTIFEDDNDRLFMYRTLGNSAENYRVEILAWCFMSNHVHLLLQAHMDNISGCMNSVLSQYARRYNKRHKRSGHLFQSRFYSTVIDSDEYLLTAVRYIHLNPISMGIGNLEEYLWSSYREYLIGHGLCNPQFIIDVFGGIEAFESFHKAFNDDQVAYRAIFEKSSTRETATDDSLIALVKATLGVENISAIAQSDKLNRDAMLVKLKSRMTVNQIARITGLGRNVIQRAGTTRADR